MQTVVTVRHGELPDDTREYIRRKCEKLVHLFERVTAITTTVEYEKDRAKVELLVDAEHKHDFVAHAEGPSDHRGDGVGPIFDGVLHKMEQQLRRYKEKLQDHRRDPSTAELTAVVPELDGPAPDDPEAAPEPV